MKNKNIARVTIVIMVILTTITIVLSGGYYYSAASWCILCLEIIGLTTAYPKNKRLIMNGGMRDFGERFEGDWTLRDALGCLFVSAFFWWFIWMDYIGKNYDELFPFIDKIMDKKSPI